MTRKTRILFAVGAVLTLACSKRALVEVPARIDLNSYDVIGVVEFSSASKGTLPAFATQRFIQSVQESQPGVRILELGNADDLKRAIGRDELDFSAMQSIRDRYKVGAVILGDLLVRDVRPNIDIYNAITTMKVSADVDASLTARLLDTERGVTHWTRSTRGKKTVAQVGVGSNGQVRFDASDPESAYGALVDALINDLTCDFRVSYVRQ